METPSGKLVWRITILTFFIMLLHGVAGVLLEYPLWFFVFIGACVLNLGLVLLYLWKGKEITAKVLFLVSSYGIIFFLTPLFGYELNTHLYLIPGVGMALIFFDDEIGFKRWWFVFAGFPVWLGIEFVGKSMPVLIPVPNNLVAPLGLVNIGFTLATSCLMFFFFAKRNKEQMFAIEEEKKEVEKSVKRLTQFNNVLLHDLKSPLATISGITEVIASSDTELSEAEKQEFFFLVNEKAQSSLRLVEGITSYFKDTKKEPPVWVNTQAVIDDVLSLLTFRPNFQVKIESRLPSVYLSEIALRQVIHNLITNAHKYNDKENGILRIFYEESKGVGKLCFADNGVGMTQEQQKIAFELYTLFHKMAESQSSGMGLAIVKELIESNDGEVEVFSEVGTGSQFNVNFKLNRFKE